VHRLGHMDEMNGDAAEAEADALRAVELLQRDRRVDLPLGWSVRDFVLIAGRLEARGIDPWNAVVWTSPTGLELLLDEPSEE
jgi:hypothetical protein